MNSFGEAIANGYPIIIGGRLPDGGGHAVTIIGTRGENDDVLIYMDTETGTLQEISNSDFADSIGYGRVITGIKKQT